jgi:hypothetical protein
MGSFRAGVNRLRFTTVRTERNMIMLNQHPSPASMELAHNWGVVAEHTTPQIDKKQQKSPRILDY